MATPGSIKNGQCSPRNNFQWQRSGAGTTTNGIGKIEEWTITESFRFEGSSINPPVGNLLVINFKTYNEATGKKSVELAKSADEVARHSGAEIIVVPQFTDIKSVSEAVEIPVFSQHIDPVKPGAYTGHVTVEAVRASGASGTLVNHSERRLEKVQIGEVVRLAREAEISALICADTPKACEEIARLSPDMIAIEPPDLIGTGIAVSKARPELITEAVSIVERVNPELWILCGAGVTTAEDVAKAIELGTRGVLVASSIVKAKNPKAAIQAMAEALLNGP